jgi:hypothetical protein
MALQFNWAAWDWAAWRANNYDLGSYGEGFNDDVVSFLGATYEHVRSVATGQVGGGVSQQDVDVSIAVHAGLANPHTVYCLTNDSRLGDARTPTAHAHAGTDITTGTVAAARLPTFGAAAAGIVPQSGGGTANYLRADGTWAAPSGGASGLSSVRKAADQTISVATPTNVTDLVFALTSGRYYRFHFILLVQSNTLTVGVAASVTHAGATRFGATVRAPFAADGAGAEWQGAITASDDPVVPTAIPAINTDYVLEISGVILASANGNLQVRARTETGTTNIVVRQASCGMLWDLGT